MVNSAGAGAALSRAVAERRLPGEPPRPRCCRHLAGSAFLRWVCRQDAGSTLGFMESSLASFRVHWDMNRVLLVLVLVLEDNPANRGRGRAGRRGGNDGSWRASSALRPCSGTMNRSESPSPGLRPPSPPPKAGERAGRGGGSWKGPQNFDNGWQRLSRLTPAGFVWMIAA